MLKEMKTYAHLKPGQRGTRQLVEKYGDALVCVRYRYDETRGVNIKTVELIIAERPSRSAKRLRDDDIVPIVVQFEETELRDKLRKARARWDPDGRVWLVCYRLVRGTELEARIPAEYVTGIKRS